MAHNLIFIPINPETGRTVGANLFRKVGRYQFRNAESKRFIGRKEFKRISRKIYGHAVDDHANGVYNAYFRATIKEECKAEIIGIWTPADNVKNLHKGAALFNGRVVK